MILIKGIAPKALDQQAFSLPVGEVSAPIKTDVGFHIIKIKEKRAEKQIGYDDIKRDLAQYLAQQKSKPRWPLISANCTIKQT